MNRFFVSYLVFFTLGFKSSIAQQRLNSSFNTNWLFYKGDTSIAPQNNQWEPVSIPHTWNKVDVNDETPGYYRGVGWYKKTLSVPSSWKGKDIYLNFEGVAQVAEVFVNGKKIGSHVGSYTSFRLLLTPYLQFSSDFNTPNQIVIRVNNQHNENIPPLSADFTFFGGIYRDVQIEVMDKTHFDADNYASSGIFISTPSVNQQTASIHIKGSFINGSDRSNMFLVNQLILDAQGKIISERKNAFEAVSNEKVTFNQEWELESPHLWSTEDPYLYQVVSQVIDGRTNQVLDEVTNPLGFRWFSFDANTGFHLNGKPLKLIGSSRHQDYKNMGNALTDDIHLRDVDLLKEMGGNFLRITHYPQDPAILEACDRLGVLTSIETPLVNRITESDSFEQNALQMHLEMIRQNYNHPSIIIWTYMNEILLMPRYTKGSAEQEKYFFAINRLANKFESLTRNEDSIRYTMIPNHGAWDLYNRVGLTKIPKLVGWNLYLGWYSGTLDDFGKFLDNHHKELPNKPLLITEYGADADIRLHNFTPDRFDKSVEYATRLHQSYLQAIKERAFVASGMIWNLADFNSEQRTETTPHINAKGLLTWDRKPKDGYLFYQANLLKTPFISIGSKEWNYRTGLIEDENNPFSVQPITIYSNLKKIAVSLNGKLIKTIQPIQGVAQVELPFRDGINYVSVKSLEKNVIISDEWKVFFSLQPQILKSSLIPFKELNVSLGDKRYYFNDISKQNWSPEQPYSPGSWGYVGGKVFTLKGSTRTGYGTTKDILGTEDDPLFQTQRVGIQQFKWDVPKGLYEITLHFAELLSPTREKNLVYNLGGNDSTEEFPERIFSVRINGSIIIENWNNKENLRPLEAVSVKHQLRVENEAGITVEFIPIKGEPILNAIQLRKVL